MKSVFVISGCMNLTELEQNYDDKIPRRLFSLHQTNNYRSFERACSGFHDVLVIVTTVLEILTVLGRNRQQEKN